MKLGTAFAAAVAATPGLTICAVCTWWALNGSGWWLIGSAFTAFLMPTVSERTVSLGGRSVSQTMVTL